MPTRYNIKYEEFDKSNTADNRDKGGEEFNTNFIILVIFVTNISIFNYLSEYYVCN